MKKNVGIIIFIIAVVIFIVGGIGIYYYTREVPPIRKSIPSVQIPDPPATNPVIKETTPLAPPAPLAQIAPPAPLAQIAPPAPLAPPSPPSTLTKLAPPATNFVIKETTPPPVADFSAFDKKLKEYCDNNKEMCNFGKLNNKPVSRYSANFYKPKNLKTRVLFLDHAILHRKN